MVDLVPVDHDPFAGGAATPAAMAPSPGLVPVDHDPFAAPAQPAAGRGFKPIAEDVLTRAQDAISFGFANKAKAALHSQLGEGTYDELLQKYRQQVDEAGKRLGGAGAVASDIAGGVLSGKALGDAGITLLGRLPQTAGWVTRTAAGALEGAGYGAAQGAGHTDTGKLEDYLRNAAQDAKTGAAVGAVLPTALSAASRLTTPFPADATRAAAVQTLKQAGVPVSAGNRTGSETLRTAEDYISKLPLGTALAKNPSADSMKAVTQAVAAKAGLPAGEVPTADVLAKGFNSVGGKIGGIQKNYPVQVDQTMLNEVANISADVPLLQTGRHGSAQYFIDKLTSGQSLSPDLAQTTRTQLNRAIKAQNGPQGDKEYQGILLDLKNSLDDALTRTIQTTGNTAHVAQLQQLRQQYANLHTLSDALYSSGPRGQLGQLTPGALQTGMARALGKGNYMQGRGDLTPLASASKAILPQVPDSYTATREGILNPVKWALSAPAQLAVNSRPAQAYWGNQLLPQGAADALAPPVLSGLLAEEQKRRARGLLSP